MNRDDIIRMAREAGGLDFTSHGWTTWVGTQSTDFLERFAELVRKDYSTAHANLWLDRIHRFMLEEREACEALHDHEDVQAPIGNSSWGEAYQEGWAQGTAAYRDAIKARGQA